MVSIKDENDYVLIINVVNQGLNDYIFVNEIVKNGDYVVVIIVSDVDFGMSVNIFFVQIVVGNELNYFRLNLFF